MTTALDEIARVRRPLAADLRHALRVSLRGAGWLEWCAMVEEHAPAGLVQTNVLYEVGQNIARELNIGLYFSRLAMSECDDVGELIGIVKRCEKVCEAFTTLKAWAERHVEQTLRDHPERASEM